MVTLDDQATLDSQEAPGHKEPQDLMDSLDQKVKLDDQEDQEVPEQPEPQDPQVCRMTRIETTFHAKL